MSPFVLENKGLTLVELLLVVSIIFILAAILYPYLTMAKHAALRKACLSNLRQIGTLLHLYSIETVGRDGVQKYPPMQDHSGTFMFETEVMYPEFVNDVAIMGCPSDKDYDPKLSFRLTKDETLDGIMYLKGSVHRQCIGPISYVYTGYAISNDSETIAFFSTYSQLDAVLAISDPTTGGWRDRTLNVASFGFTGMGTGGTDTIFRLQSNIQRFLITDINNIVGNNAPRYFPVMWDQLSTSVDECNHIPPFQNILYSDGGDSYGVEPQRYEKGSRAFPRSPFYACVNDWMEPKQFDYCP